MSDYTFQYFVEECFRFREEFGSQRFWKLDQEQRGNAIRGLAWVAMRCDGDDDTVGLILRTHIEEYLRRAFLMRVWP